MASLALEQLEITCRDVPVQTCLVETCLIETWLLRHTLNRRALMMHDSETKAMMTLQTPTASHGCLCCLLKSAGNRYHILSCHVMSCNQERTASWILVTKDRYIYADLLDGMALLLLGMV